MTITDKLQDCNTNIVKGKAAIGAAFRSIGISGVADTEEFSTYADHIRLCSAPATLPEPTGAEALELISDPRSNLIVSSGLLLTNNNGTPYNSYLGQSTVNIVDNEHSPSKKSVVFDVWSSAISTNRGGFYYKIVEFGKTYSVSFWARSIRGEVNLQYGGNRSAHFKESVLTTDWEYYTHTFTNTDTSEYNIRVIFLTPTPNVSFEIHSPILVEGTKPYRWGETYLQRIQNINDRVVYDKKLLNDAF